jgi:hypothetical protein
MALECFFTGSTQLCAIPLQALLNGHIVTQLFSAKAGSIARTRGQVFRHIGFAGKS